MSRPVLLEVSAETAGHLAVAIRAYRKAARANYLAVPADLIHIEAAMAERAMKGQDGTPVDELWQVQEAASVTPELLSIADTARKLRCSERTVKRRIAAGELAAVKDGRLTRIRPTDIAAYLQRLNAA